MEEKLDKIISLLEELVHNSNTYKGFDRWTVEQEEFVCVLYNLGYGNKEIAESIKRTFNIDRTVGAIHSRLNKLGLKSLTENERTQLRADL